MMDFYREAIDHCYIPGPGNGQLIIDFSRPKAEPPKMTTRLGIDTTNPALVGPYDFDGSAVQTAVDKAMRTMAITPEQHGARQRTLATAFGREVPNQWICPPDPKPQTTKE